jgi:hypothetical protein
MNQNESEKGRPVAVYDLIEPPWVTTRFIESLWIGPDRFEDFSDGRIHMTLKITPDTPVQTAAKQLRELADLLEQQAPWLGDTFDKVTKDPEKCLLPCPRCDGESVCLNIGPNHWCICEKCKVRWPVGGNLFSCWQYETEADWRRNAEILRQYTPARDETPGLSFEELFRGFQKFMPVPIMPTETSAAAMQQERLIKERGIWPPPDNPDEQQKGPER